LSENLVDLAIKRTNLQGSSERFEIEKRKRGVFGKAALIPKVAKSKSTSNHRGGNEEEGGSGPDLRVPSSKRGKPRKSHAYVRKKAIIWATNFWPPV